MTCCHRMTEADGQGYDLPRREGSDHITPVDPLPDAARSDLGHVILSHTDKQVDRGYHREIEGYFVANPARAFAFGEARA